MKTLVIVCVVLASVYTFCEACSCIFQHPQVVFCNADFVVRARILRRIDTGSSPYQDVYYSAYIRQHYKGGSRTRRRFQRIYTARNSATCGVSFQTGREYIIAGSIRNNRWRAQLCSWNPQSSSLSQFQRNALRYGYYRNNCFCNIRDCTLPGRSRCSASTRNECVIRDNSDCFKRNNACVSNRGTCRWQSATCRYATDFGVPNRLGITSLQ